MDSCVFCNYQDDDKGIVIFENELCQCIQLNHPVLIGSCMIIPKAHKVTVFDLSPEEWEATRQLTEEAKRYIDAKYNPDGYNLGWNAGAAAGQTVFHAHLHIIPRYADEPYAGRGIRSWIKQKDNTRPR